MLPGTHLVFIVLNGLGWSMRKLVFSLLTLKAWSRRRWRCLPCLARARGLWAFPPPPSLPHCFLATDFLASAFLINATFRPILPGEGGQWGAVSSLWCKHDNSCSTKVCFPWYSHSLEYSPPQHTISITTPCVSLSFIWILIHMFAWPLFVSP